LERGKALAQVVSSRFYTPCGVTLFGTAMTISAIDTRLYDEFLYALRRDLVWNPILVGWF
jgi:hypothetical protein